MPDRNSIGRDFEKAFNEGMKNNDWSSLNDVIVKSVDNFLDSVGDKMNVAMGDAVPLSQRKEDMSAKTRTAEMQRKLHAERQRERERMAMERKRREDERARRRIAKQTRTGPGTAVLAFPYRNVGAGSSVALIVSGGIGAGVSLVTLLTNSVTALLGSVHAGGLALGAVLFAGFSVLLGKGISQSKSLNLAKRYVRAIGNRQYMDIETLALSVNKSEKRVVKDLRKLLDEGFFPQGHLDRNAKTFILTDEVFDHYLELETKGSSNIIDTTARPVDEQEFPTLSPEESAELSRMIKEGGEYINRFHRLNDEIPGIEISAKLDRLEGLLKEIFVRVREHPEQMSRIHELMDYYLPTAVKLVEAYNEYDKVSEPGKEILSAKQDIENTLDTINSALGKLLNRLFKDSVLDVTTDAQVLKTVLAQKGLSSGTESILSDKRKI